jgi:phosphopantothenoylcysteine decarboxylase/phosphopantothenate--cysteine ligase
LKSLRILVTAGPTREPIDPVRFISNHSTGKMGIAIADAFAEQGGKVDLVLGPSGISPSAEVNVIRVESAEQMFQECLQIYPTIDIAVFAAAVADYTPKKVSSEKIKKISDEWYLELVKTKDIAAELGKMKTPRQLNIIFALETDNEIANALDKLQKKNADIVVLNSLKDEGAGFGYDTNQVTLLFKNGLTLNFALQSKQSLARKIVSEAIKSYRNLTA